MLSVTAKIIIIVIVSSLTAFINIAYSPFHDYFQKKEEPKKEIITEEKDRIDPHTLEQVATTTTIKETPSATTTQPLPKPNNKISVYEELETKHSDTDESYRPNVSPCTSPMTYKIGTFDSRFNISKDEFLRITKNAVTVWSKETNGPLFTHDPRGSLTINLIYDERQASTENIGYLALEIENTKQSADAMLAIHEKEKEQYIRDSEDFTKNATSLQERFASYESRVKEYNAKGGATKPEYDAMMLELAGLKKESASLEEKQKELLTRMEEINARVKRYNELVAYVNTLIRRSNALGSRTFTEGRFTPSTNTIDIYQYADETKLERVLIHEFGHVLGIGHVKNVQSIMYSFNSGTSTSLSLEDKKALKGVCSLQ